jgi:hypothetical protein
MTLSFLLPLTKKGDKRFQRKVETSRPLLWIVHTENSLHRFGGQLYTMLVGRLALVLFVSLSLLTVLDCLGVQRRALSRGTE